MERVGVGGGWKKNKTGKSREREKDAGTDGVRDTLMQHVDAARLRNEINLLIMQIVQTSLNV
jgi:hypothetical protein